MTERNFNHSKTATPDNLHIMVVDDDPATRGLLESFLRSEGHTVALAEHGAAALTLFEKDQSFDMFIIDVTMPIMNGSELCRVLSKRLEHWVPIIMISANADENDQVAGLDIGADYYLTKPISLALLRAKVAASQRIARLQRELQSSNEQLEDYYNNNRSDNDLARQLLDGILHHGQDKILDARYMINPAGDFSGDLFISMSSPAQRHYSMVADATGHGLPAAITLLPAVETFSRLAREGYSLETVVREVNARLKDSLPRGRFVAATVIMIEAHTRRLEIWNGGNPTAYLINNPERAIISRFPAQHPPLGIMNDDDFDARIQSYAYQPEHTLVACTDGVVEAEAADHSLFGKQGLESLLLSKTRHDDILIELNHKLMQFTGTQPTDDRTVLVLPLDQVIDNLPAIVAQSKPDTAPPEEIDAPSSGAWFLSVGVQGESLQEAELAPLIHGLLAQIGVTGDDADRAHVCVTELINNALDHGVLKLDSSLKETPDGFDTYFNERHRRLQMLRDGSVFIRMKLDRIASRHCLQVAVSDSGDGFATKKGETNHDQDGAMCPVIPHGRGIRLVQRLADRLMFHDGGATAEFYMSLSTIARGH